MNIIQEVERIMLLFIRFLKRLNVILPAEMLIYHITLRRNEMSPALQPKTSVDKTHLLTVWRIIEY